MNNLENYLPIFNIVADASRELKIPVYLVGGVVRDAILNSNQNYPDLDFTIEGELKALAEYLVQQLPGKLVFHDQFLTAKLKFESEICGISEIDIVTARSETYEKSGALPLVQSSNLTNDLQRRDFSINTLAITVDSLVSWLNKSIKDQDFLSIIIDQHAGLADLDAKVIRILHKKSFIDDPTRIFRAARYQVRINGALENETLKQLHEALDLGVLQNISTQRILRELLLILDEVDSRLILLQLSNWQVFSKLGWLDANQEKEFVKVVNINAQFFPLNIDNFKLLLLSQKRVEERAAFSNLLIVSKKLISKWKKSNIDLLQEIKVEQLNRYFVEQK
jgi:tRNA nucleotidyltransferase (CCA-adding enzyme)